jgi:acyl carrier protein
MTAPSIYSVAENVLARHVQRDIRKIPMWHSLNGDLHLTPLALVTVALEIESVAHIDLSVEALANIETVGDFFMCLSRAAAHHGEARDGSQPLPRPRSTRVRRRRQERGRRSSGDLGADRRGLA